MSVEISELGCRSCEWDDFVRRSADGSPFHLTAWKRVVEQTFHHRPYYLMASRSGEVEGVLPLFEVRWPLGRRALISVPYGVYGGVCAISADARLSLVEAAGNLGQRIGAGYVELRHRREQGLDLPTKALYVTFSREISADASQNADAIPRKQRRMTRQGVKHGLRVEIGRCHLDGFYEIYAHSVRNLGSPVFPRELFEAILACFGKEADILTVWRGERMVAGVMSLFFQRQVLPYYGGALREAFAWAASDFMYWELMCHAARAGCRIFDFGRSREGSGSYHFKRHWGFDPVPLSYQYLLLRKDTVPNLSPANPRVRGAVKLWKHLPLGVANTLGPVLTRYLP